MLSLLRSTSVVLALALTAGCHDGGGGGAVPLSDVKARAADAVCEYEVRCGAYPDVATCKASVTSRTDQLVASVNAGRIHYDGTAAAACLNTIRATGCNRSDSLADAPAACASAFKGTLQGGATCFADEECVSASCDQMSCSGSGCCTGTCTAPQTVANPVPVGGDCSAAAAICADGSACSHSSTASICTAGPSLGQDCHPAGLAASGCLNHAVCLPSGSALGGTCTIPPAEGQACDSATNPCNSSNDYCNPLTGTCARRIAPGAACPAGTGCVEYARCDSSTGMCAAEGRLGETCDDSLGSPACLGSLYCTSGTCVLPAPEPVCP